MTSILKADTIQDTDGNNIINENSNTVTIGKAADTVSIVGNATLGASGKTITIPAGATITNSGTATGFGETNTPAWNAYMSAQQTLVGDTYTVINCDTETVDTNSAYDTSTKRFTVPSGHAGTYFYYIIIRETYDTDKELRLALYKNGSMYHQYRVQLNPNGNAGRCYQTSGILELAVNDYVEARYLIGENPVSGVLDNGVDNTKFGGFKIRGS